MLYSNMMILLKYKYYISNHKIQIAYVCIYGLVCVFMYVCICVCVVSRLGGVMCSEVIVWVCAYRCVSVCAYRCVSVCVCVCICVCVYMSVVWCHTQIHTYTYITLTIFQSYTT